MLFASNGIEVLNVSMASTYMDGLTSSLCSRVISNGYYVNWIYDSKPYQRFLPPTILTLSKVQISAS